MRPHDYIIVGAGAAGCVLAGRLTEDPDVRAPSVESGRERRSPLLSIPAAGTVLMGNPKYGWCFETDADPAIEGRSVSIPRGRLLAYRARELVPGPDVRMDEESLAYSRAHGDTSYHPVGTCRMGDDPMAVVDHRLRVHGVTGLRVIDASFMPSMVSGNTNAASLMIGEKGAAIVREDQRNR